MKLNWIIFVTAIVEDTSSWSKYPDHHLKHVSLGKIPATGNTGLKEVMRTSVTSCSAQVQTFVC